MKVKSKEPETWITMKCSVCGTDVKVLENTIEPTAGTEKMYVFCENHWGRIHEARSYYKIGYLPDDCR